MLPPKFAIRPRDSSVLGRQLRERLTRSYPGGPNQILGCGEPRERKSKAEGPYRGDSVPIRAMIDRRAVVLIQCT